MLEVEAEASTMFGSEGVDFVMTSILFLLFMLGMVVAYQGVVGHDPDVFGAVWGPPSKARWDPYQPGPRHPHDRHGLLRVAIGVVIMAVAATTSIVLLG